MKVWITGIGGLLGSHLADKLIERGDSVGGNDNFICGSPANVPSRAYFRLFDCAQSSKIWDFQSCWKKENFGVPDVLVHCAATAAEGLSVFSPHFITRNIAEASVRTISAAIAAGVKRIVFFSSMARYGHGNPPFKEDDATAPVDPYGLAKVYAENVLRVLCEQHGVKWSIVVPHNVIGTRQQITPYRNVATIFLNRLKLDLPVYIYGDGEQKRCFSPIRDCLHSLVRVVDGDADGEIVNIGPDGGEITINQLLSICEEAVGKKAKRVYLPPRPITDTVTQAYCSSDKARSLLGYEAQQSMRECINEMAKSIVPVPFNYSFPIEIEKGCPETWLKKL